MKKLFKQIFPLYFKLKDGYVNETDTELSDKEHIELYCYYVVGKSYPIIIILTIIIYKSLEYLLK